MLLVSTDIAFSNAIFLTILLHSSAFRLASASLGRALATCERDTTNIIRFALSE